MTQRKPPPGLDPKEIEEKLDTLPKEGVWHCYRCTLVTPMYGGGVKAGEVDKEMPIRATAIRGQLRFWWRLLNRRQYPDAKRLFEAERAIWGGLGDEKTLAASKVVVRVEPISKPDFVKFGDETDLDVKYAFGAAANSNFGDWLRQQHEWMLYVSAPPECWPEVERVIRWWVSFGGVGARTRRGFGAIEALMVKDTGGEIALQLVDEDEARGAGMTLKLGATNDSSRKAWAKAVGTMREFRQAPGIGRRTKAAGNTGKSPGRSYWPEPDAIRLLTNQWFGKHALAQHQVKEHGQWVKVGTPHNHKPNHSAGKVFPRAAFGLPIIFHFKDKRDGDPADVTLQPVNADRMASPIILKPYRAGDGRWQPACLVLPTDHVWSMALIAKGVGRHGQSDPEFAAGQWWPAGHGTENHARELANTILPMADTGKADPIAAFLAFFSREVGQ